MKKTAVVFLAFVLAFASLFTIAPQTSKAVTKGESIVAYAMKFEGTPYLFGGSTPAAFDCSGYILYVYNQFGIKLPRTSETQFQVGTPVSRNNLQAGDLVFFENTYKPGISHAGIYIGNGDFLSAKTGGVGIANIECVGLGGVAEFGAIGDGTSMITKSSGCLGQSFLNPSTCGLLLIDLRHGCDVRVEHRRDHVGSDDGEGSISARRLRSPVFEGLSGRLGPVIPDKDSESCRRAVGGEILGSHGKPPDGASYTQMRTMAPIMRTVPVRLSIPKQFYGA